MHFTTQIDHVKKNLSLVTTLKPTGCRNMKSDVSPYPQTKPRIWLNPAQMAASCDKKRMWLKAVSQELKLTDSEINTLESLSYKTDPLTGVGAPSIETIIKSRKGAVISYRTALRHLDKLTKLGVLEKSTGSRKNVPRGKTPPKLYKLKGFCYELTDQCDKLSHSLNITDLKDLNTKQTKKERVSIVNNLYEEYEQERKTKTKRQNNKGSGDKPMKSTKPSCRLLQTEEMELTKLKNDFSLTDAEFSDLKHRYIAGRAKSDIRSTYDYAKSICNRILKDRNEQDLIRQKVARQQEEQRKEFELKDKWKAERVPKPEGLNFRKMLGL